MWRNYNALVSLGGVVLISAHMAYAKQDQAGLPVSLPAFSGRTLPVKCNASHPDPKKWAWEY